MPVPIAAKAGVIAISVAVAAAIAIYESPEIRRAAEDLRRRIAVALHSLGDGIQPPPRRGAPAGEQPLFNRPEDAEGFLQSGGVDADDETRRRQREELLYWNALREEKQERERRRGSAQGSTFDDFLREDASGEKGTYVFNTGADVPGADGTGLVRRHGRHRDGAAGGLRGLRGLRSSAAYADPFGDEHGIEPDEQEAVAHITPTGDEMASDDGGTDIYNATEKTPPSVTSPHPLPALPSPPALVSIEEAPQPEQPADGEPARPPLLLERELEPDEYMTAGQEDAYASIQAWAQGSAAGGAAGFYSPLPVSPAAPLSEPELVSAGARTPTATDYAASLAGSGEEVGHDDDAGSSRAGAGGRYYDVMSEDSDDAGMATPASWTEVGSVVSESDNGAARA